MDLDEERDSSTFEPGKWIQRGLKYQTVPFHVINAHLHALNIPETAPPLPCSSVPITEFLCLTLPIQSVNIITSKPDQWFSNGPPKEDMSILLTHPIPNMEFLAQLKATAGQAWLDGATSVVDKRFDDSQDRLPLWVISYWIKLGAVVGTQAEWRRAKRWIEDNSRGPSFPFKTLDNLFSLLGWDMSIQFLSRTITAKTLAPLLSTRWLSCDIMDLMINDLQSRLRQRPDLSSKVIIAPSDFYKVIEKATQTGYKDHHLPKSLQNVEAQVNDGGKHILYMGVFVGGNHEIVVYVDFENSTYGWGESTFYIL